MFDNTNMPVTAAEFTEPEKFRLSEVVTGSEGRDLEFSG